MTEIRDLGYLPRDEMGLMEDGKMWLLVQQKNVQTTLKIVQKFTHGANPGIAASARALSMVRACLTVSCHRELWIATFMRISYDGHFRRS